MAQRKFSDLVSAARINKADLLALEQTDGTKKATFAQLCTEIAVQEIAEQIEDFPEITEEDTLSVIVGKINKWQKDVIRKINDSAVDILDSKEEIEANTENGKVAGALAVKAMADELNGKMSIRSLLFRENIPPNTEYVYDDNVSLGSILLLGGTWNHKEMYVLYISYIEEGWRNLIVNRIASYNSYSTFEFRITDAGKLAIKNIMEVTQPTLAYMIDSP